MSSKSNHLSRSDVFKIGKWLTENAKTYTSEVEPNDLIKKIKEDIDVSISSAKQLRSLMDDCEVWIPLKMSNKNPMVNYLHKLERRLNALEDRLEAVENSMTSPGKARPLSR